MNGAKGGKSLCTEKIDTLCHVMFSLNWNGLDFTIGHGHGISFIGGVISHMCSERSSHDEWSSRRGNGDKMRAHGLLQGI